MKSPEDFDSYVDKKLQEKKAEAGRPVEARGAQQEITAVTWPRAVAQSWGGVRLWLSFEN